MKRTTLFLSFIAIIAMVAFSSCNSEKKRAAEELKSKQEQEAKAQAEQNAFLSVLTNPGSDNAILESIAKKAMSEKSVYFASVAKGETVLYVVGKKKYKGQLPFNFPGALIGNKIYFANGAVVENAEKLKLVKKEPVSWTNFKSIWSFDEILPYVLEYELSMYDNELRFQPIWDLEFYLDHWTCDSVYIFPKPAGILKIGEKEYLVGQEGKMWNTRKESMAGRGERYTPRK